ncbi:hypothetical protein V5O48_004028 [Marasmius crinis-equi]|uniref:Uncharacterized protein n=1 Tax=Marasmius crinis-equi TaxID=585013 RepID=A0ABR3FR91_9AGAR
MFHVLRSGKRYCFPVFPPARIDLLTLTNNAANETFNPPITLEQDLGPDPLSNNDYEAIVGDPEEDEEEEFVDDDDDDEEEEDEGMESTSHQIGPDIGVTSSPQESSTSEALPTRAAPARQSRKNAKRCQKRRMLRDQDLPTPKRVYDRVLGEAETLSVDLEADRFDAAKGAHTGKPGVGSKTDKARTAIYTVEDLKSKGFRHVQWDGRTPMPIVDSTGRIISCLLGRPNDPTYDAALESLFDEVIRITDERDFGQEGDSRRGQKFKAFNSGIAMPMGSKRPVNLSNGDMAETLEHLMGHEGTKRLYYEYKDTLNESIDRLDELKAEEELTGTPSNTKPLKRNFPNSVFSCCTFNFGRNVWTYKHRDFFNWPFGWCFITALGRFDATKGGQLVLWELKLVIDFPAGATVAIPSAVVTHSNIPVAKGDMRSSFTEYSSGLIFRWRENGFRTEKELEKEDKKKYQDMLSRKEQAYLERVQLYSTLEELTVSV